MILLTGMPLERMAIGRKHNGVKILNMESLINNRNYRFVAGIHGNSKTGYMIHIGKNFLKIDKDGYVVGTRFENDANLFDIEHTKFGYKIIYNKKCVTKGTETGTVFLSDCFDDGSHNSVFQRFDFISLKKPNNSKALSKDKMCKKPEKNTDISNLDVNLEQKFYDSIFDKNFSSSFDFIVSLAKCRGNDVDCICLKAVNNPCK
ncbi:hypothetical protein CWI38_1523p0040 [Hamiltosporidium tvaerminnensis]|uniref:Uncharacterized protein n=2 Tax=Hamiltosporidium TaxID=1176354 RepID=A0A4V2JUU5_9MICR|nr:hypothetical protein CWI37_0711p0040 [Hamiltosporidium tvaerminnensis]TBU05780.1 hypothetical protein CWI39_0623p0040 [Hamiltosporidium magnivora]TBU10834.1 hypothetical protein CWI38_1523p0040 [Hamiltosporidium tvaerminnensis]